MVTLLRRIAFVTAALLVAMPCASAEFVGKVIDELVEAPPPDVAVEQANTAALASFQAALAVYDRRIEREPSDIIARLQRCSFMEDFAGSYEIATFATKIGEQAEECMQQFDASYAGHPEVELRHLQSNALGADMLDQGEVLLSTAQARSTWTSGQLGRLYSLLARNADGNNNAAGALKYALLALQMDEESNVRLIAATHLIARGDKERALEILRAPIQAAEGSGYGWQLTRKMKLLLEAGAPQDAVALYPQLRETRYYSHVDAAKTLLAAGASELARQELESATKNGNYTTQDEGERFRLELEHGTSEAALAAYQAWRDHGWQVDPLGINRMALLARDVSLPLQPRDILSAFALGGVCVLLALLAALPIATIHYRGLAVRAKTGEPYPRADWPLQQAWLALTAFFVASVLALYFGGALDLHFRGDTLWDLQPTGEQSSNIALAESLLAILGLLPFAVRARRIAERPWSTQWSIGKCLAVGAAIGVALRVPMVIAWAARPESIRALLPDDVLWQMMSGVKERYSLVAALWILAVAAPVTEEFLFRGILYRAFAAHIRPLWANLLQAALFSAMHLQDVRGSILLFVLGLALGTVTRRSGGLLAAMTLHAVFNLIAGVIILDGSG